MRIVSCTPLCFVAASISVLLTGCGAGPAAPLSSSTGLSIQGVVHGGQQPLAGDHVYLFAANTTGYGGNGIAASSSNASVSLLNNVPGSTTLDSSGGPTNGDYYVTTDNAGGFSITSDYTCTPGQQVYIYALGGNPTYPSGTVNSAAGLLAILGNCPAAGSFVATTPNVFVDEVSTIAAAYSFAAFASDAVHVSSSGTTLAKTGIAIAFANAANLASLSTGNALATTPAGNGTVPQSTINTLANILAACINSTGPASTACTTLFSNALSGGSTGTTPTDTATAAINIAHNPGANITALYGSPTPTTPFNPTLGSKPNDFTIALTFTGGGLDYPQGVAIDAAGNAWVANYNNNSVSEFSSTGAPISTSTGFTGGGLNGPYGIAVDGSGNIWTANYAHNTLSEFSSSGTAISPSGGYAGGGLSDPYALAIDGSGNIWIANYGNNSLSKFSSSGTVISPSTGYTGGGLNNPVGISIDGSGNVWVANFGNSSVSKFSNSGTAISPSTGYTGGGLDGSLDVANDSSGNVWISSYYNNSVSEFSNSGTAISPSTGYTGGGISAPYTIAVDGADNIWTTNYNNSLSELTSSGTFITPSTGYKFAGQYAYGFSIDGAGNAWIVNSGTNTVTEEIGAAAPVITPLCAALPSTPTVNGSSNLGTRP